MERIQSGKKVYLEVIRLLAVCLVIFNHTDGYFLYFSNTDNPVTYMVSLFFSVLCRINVPLFFMVSGALLLGKKESIKELYRKRIKRILQVLLLFSGLQYIVSVQGRIGAGEAGIGDFLVRLYTGNIADSYWFLYAYLAVLAMLPLFRKMAGGMDAEDFRYLFFLKLLSDVVFRLTAVYTGCTAGMEIPLVTDSIFYLFAGYYMEWKVPEERYDGKGIAERATAAGAGLILVSMALVWLENRVLGAYSQSCLGIFSPILTIIAYYMVKSCCSRHVMSQKVQDAVICLGSAVFGIYLIEPLARKQLLPLYLYLCDKTVGLAACFVYVAGTFMLSAIYVGIIKKIPWIGKLI